jgi:hypothetical protein
MLDFDPRRNSSSSGGPIINHSTSASVSLKMNLENAADCPEFSPTYYATYFGNPSGNLFEARYRMAPRSAIAP